MDFVETTTKTFIFMEDYNRTVFWLEDMIFFRKFNYTSGFENSTHPFVIEVRLSHHPEQLRLRYSDEDIFERDWLKLTNGGK